MGVEFVQLRGRPSRSQWLIIFSLIPADGELQNFLMLPFLNVQEKSMRNDEFECFLYVVRCMTSQFYLGLSKDNNQIHPPSF